MTRKSGLIEILLGAALLLPGCATSRHIHLLGKVNGPNYTSAQGGFSVPFPVSAEGQGRHVLGDTQQSVTFTDSWGARITFWASAPFDAHGVAMLETQGREKTLSEFALRAYGNSMTLHYHPDVREGAISFIVRRMTGSKTAVAAFIHGQRLFLAETDQYPGMQVLAPSDEQSQLNQEDVLEKQALELAQSLQVK